MVWLQNMLQIVTSAVYSISIESIFARTVIGSSGIVTHSINITAVVPLAHSSISKTTKGI